MDKIESQKSYIYGLERNGAVIDTTSINDKDKNFAKELFYTQYGHTAQPNDKIILIEEVFD